MVTLCLSSLEHICLSVLVHGNVPSRFQPGDHYHLSIPAALHKHKHNISRFFPASAQPRINRLVMLNICNSMCYWCVSHRQQSNANGHQTNPAAPKERCGNVIRARLCLCRRRSVQFYGVDDGGNRWLYWGVIKTEWAKMWFPSP